MMIQQQISEEVAFRIGLASRALPGISVGDLIEALQKNLGDDINEKSLCKITVTNLKTAFGQTYSLDGEEDGEDSRFLLSQLKEAVKVLWGEIDEIDQFLLPIEAYQEGEMPNSIRVAVASNNDEELDGHFGSCLRFLVYQLSATDLKLIDARSTAKADESDDKNGYRLGLIKDCHVLYVASIGGPAAAKVVQGGVYPMKVTQGGSARDILGQLQQKIATSPPPWVAKILGISQSDRVKNYQG
jgi:nitrogen fixation protein NifX